MYIEWISIVGLILTLLWMNAGVTLLKDRVSNLEFERTGISNYVSSASLTAR